MDLSEQSLVGNDEGCTGYPGLDEHDGVIVTVSVQ